MRLSAFLTTVAVLCLDLLLCPGRGFAGGADKVKERAGLELFEKRVRPILFDNCLSCHSSELSKPKADLRLDSLAAMLRGGRSGPALVPGEPERSLMILAVQHDPTLTPMPFRSKLPKADVLALYRWVKLGAPWPGAKVAGNAKPKVAPQSFVLTPEARHFWAFQPPQLPPIPKVRNQDWVQTPIDAFVLAKLEAAGLTPAPPADRRTLIRRVTLDLHGLPPTPEEVDTFLADQAPDAFARLVERLLASPRYGERWGRHWLDVARYADSNGMDDNIAWADAWRYRDYVIRAFNSDMPYDQFVREQLAGDLLTTWDDPNRNEARIATGFLMVGPKMPSADDPVKQQLDVVDEQLDTTGKAFLGLTVACARCHDHKFDPIPTSDYYALAGIFKSTRTMLSYRVTAKVNLVALGGREQNALLHKVEAEYDRHDDAVVNGNRLAMSATERQAHEKGLSAALAKMKAIPTALAVEEGQVADMKVLLRGNHLTPGPLAPRGFLSVLVRGSLPPLPQQQSGRRELADWLTRPDHPLTARVLVNRLWLWHFGQGIVRSPDNFGRLGERPDNQPLLDWLAVQLVRSGWSLKAMHRLILNSSAYQMSGQWQKAAALQDPDNRLWWCFPRQKTSAEMLRDSLLAVSGRLDPAMGGSLLAFDNHKILGPKDIQQFNATFALPRRTVYLPVVRSGLNDYLQAFDFPDPAVSSGKRDANATAQQALYLMNSPFVGEAAQHLAGRLFADQGWSDEQRITLAYRLVLSRPPQAAEVKRWRTFLTEYQQAERIASASAATARERAWQAFCRVLLSCNEFVYVD